MVGLVVFVVSSHLPLNSKLRHLPLNSKPIRLLSRPTCLGSLLISNTMLHWPHLSCPRYTLFAPLDLAWAALSNRSALLGAEPDIDALAFLLRPANIQQLAAMLSHHVLLKEITAAQLSDGQVSELPCHASTMKHHC